MAIDKSVFLAGGEGPEPVWRDEAPDAASWPERAVFKLVFTRETCGDVAYDLPTTEFFGADGWPVDFPSVRKHLSDAIKQDLQALPRLWREWNEPDWQDAEAFPESWTRSRRLASTTRAMTAVV